MVDTNRAARNFLELLARLRVVFLQAEVILPLYIKERLLEIVRRTNPSSRTLSFGGESFPTTLSSVTPLFATAEFPAFATDMEHICSSTREEDPHLVAVAKAVPAMAERLRTTAATVEAGNAATVTALADLRAELAEVKASLQDFVQGAFLFYLHAYAVEDVTARLGSSPVAGAGAEAACLAAVAVPFEADLPGRQSPRL